jgi:hypothetical protein
VSATLRAAIDGGVTAELPACLLPAEAVSPVPHLAHRLKHPRHRRP